VQIAKELTIEPIKPARFVAEKRSILITGLLLVLIYVLSLFVIHDRVHDFVIQDRLDDLNRHLIYQKSLHHYIENTGKPVYYEMQAKGELSKDFFDPRGLSFTYIARHILEDYTARLEKENLPVWRYRLASDNARNPINDATPKERALLERFNQDRSFKQLKEIRQVNGSRVLYVATPIGENKASCLRCHSHPEAAPKQLLELYGKERGFNEKIGHIRAFIAYEANLDHPLLQGRTFFFTVAAILLALFILIFLGITWANIRVQRKQHVIKQQQSRLHFLAHHDTLTQLLNRHSLNQNLPEVLQTLNEASLSIMMIDIDFFKKVNDSYGHNVGDLVLKEVGEKLQSIVQVNPEIAAYRIGGEEFVLTIKGYDRKFVLALYQQLQQQFAEIQVDDVLKGLTISAGATIYQQGDKQFDLLKRADQALYQAKEQGRNNLVFN